MNAVAAARARSQRSRRSLSQNIRDAPLTGASSGVRRLGESASVLSGKTTKDAATLKQGPAVSIAAVRLTLNTGNVDGYRSSDNATFAFRQVQLRCRADLH